MWEFYYVSSICIISVSFNEVLHIQLGECNVYWLLSVNEKLLVNTWKQCVLKRNHSSQMYPHLHFSSNKTIDHHARGHKSKQITCLWTFHFSEVKGHPHYNWHLPTEGKFLCCVLLNHRQYMTRFWTVSREKWLVMKSQASATAG